MVSDPPWKATDNSVISLLLYLLHFHGAARYLARLWRHATRTSMLLLHSLVRTGVIRKYFSNFYSHYVDYLQEAPTEFDSSDFFRVILGQASCKYIIMYRIMLAIQHCSHYINSSLSWAQQHLRNVSSNSTQPLCREYFQPLLPVFLFRAVPWSWQYCSLSEHGIQCSSIFLGSLYSHNQILQALNRVASW